jgi:tetratricopeptide (TPR) repeat protein
VRSRAQWVAGLSLFLAVTGCFGQSTAAPPAARQTALALEQQGRIAEAEAAWQAILKAHPSNPEAYAHLGLLEAHQQHYKQAVPYYRKALAINPNVPGLRLDLGLALFKDGQINEAIPQFKILLKSAQPHSQDAQRFTILIGMAYYGRADYANAAPYLRAAAAQDTTSLPLLLALAHSYLWSKQYQPVLDVYHQILTLDPNSAEADMLAGEALDEMKDNEGSTKMFRAAVAANPKEPNVHFGLGYLLWAQKLYPEAASEFKAELVNNPDHVQSMMYLADSDIQMNQTPDARPLLEKVIKLDPSLPLAHLDLGVILSDAGNKSDGLRELTLAEKLQPNEVNVHWRLGRLYRTLGRKDEAKAEFDKASSLNKAADESLFKKIAGGNPHPPQGQAPGTPPPAQ